MNDILRPTALPWWGRRREAMPLRWSLADPVASVAINMALQKELFASSRLPRRREKDTYKVPHLRAQQLNDASLGANPGEDDTRGRVTYRGGDPAQPREVHIYITQQ